MKSNPATVASNSEVPERAARRQFRAEYKAGILAEYEKAGRGEQGALLRREGLYSSHIDAWRKLSEAGVLSAPAIRETTPCDSAARSFMKPGFAPFASSAARPTTCASTLPRPLRAFARDGTPLAPAHASFLRYTQACRPWGSKGAGWSSLTTSTAI